MAVLNDNWVVLKPGVSVRLHFAAHRVTDRVIHDKIFDRDRTIKSLIFLVDEEDGVQVDKMFSVVSGRLADDLSGYLPGERYTDFIFTLIKDAPGTVPPRIASVNPRR